MTKYLCDRCGHEVSHYGAAPLKVACQYGSDDYHFKTCSDCAKVVFRAIQDTITNLRGKA